MDNVCKKDGSQWTPGSPHGSPQFKKWKLQANTCNIFALKFSYVTSIFHALEVFLPHIQWADLKFVATAATGGRVKFLSAV